MSISISSAVVAAEVAAADSVANSAVAARPATVANGAGDTVQLSEAQQVYQLYNHGQTVSQIASNLSLTVELVNSYLGITKGAS
jgi:DNA-binding CsgD family transcriptional regulator